MEEGGLVSHKAWGVKCQAHKETVDDLPYLPLCISLPSTIFYALSFMSFASKNSNISDDVVLIAIYVANVSCIVLYGYTGIQQLGLSQHSLSVLSSESSLSSLDSCVAVQSATSSLSFLKLSMENGQREHLQYVVRQWYDIPPASTSKPAWVTHLTSSAFVPTLVFLPRIQPSSLALIPRL